MNLFRLLIVAAAACYFLFQDLLSVPDHVSAYCILAWGVAAGLDLHGTLRTPSMMKYETNPLFAFLHSRLSWASIPVQLSVELGILGSLSLFANDPFQTFGLACACAAALHVWGWHRNECFRQTYNLLHRKNILP